MKPEFIKYFKNILYKKGENKKDSAYCFIPSYYKEDSEDDTLIKEFSISEYIPATHFVLSWKEIGKTFIVSIQFRDGFGATNTRMAEDVDFEIVI